MCEKDEALQIGADGKCPHCGVDLTTGDARVCWKSVSLGDGWLNRDVDGVLSYEAKSSSDYDEVVGFYCYSCNRPVSLPDEIEEEWS